MQVRIIYGQTCDETEKNVNEWLRSNSNKEIVDINFAVDDKCKYVVIVYKEEYYI